MLEELIETDAKQRRQREVFKRPRGETRVAQLRKALGLFDTVSLALGGIVGAGNLQGLRSLQLEPLILSSKENRGKKTSA